VFKHALNNVLVGIGIGIGIGIGKYTRASRSLIHNPCNSFQIVRCG
jgi:hypothetical protein